MTFLVCGEALYDVFVGRATPGGFELDARIGGSAFNVALGLARLGRPAGLLTGIGTDPLGARLASALADEGVTTQYLARKDLRTTLALVALGPDGGARYSFYGEGAADRAVTQADLPSLDGLAGLHFGCLSLLSEPTGSSFLALAQRATAAGDARPLITTDPNIRPSVEPDMAVWRARVDAFAALSDLVKVSAEDLEALHPDLDEAAAAARWRAMGAGLVLVTRGGDGASAYGPWGQIEQTAPAIEVADTVGAGDSFLAGFLAALDEMGCATPAALAGAGADTMGLAVAFAVGAAAETCRRRGADLPRRGDLPSLTAP